MIRPPLAASLLAALGLAACSAAPQSPDQLFAVKVQPETVSLKAHVGDSGDPFAGDVAPRFDTLVAGYLAHGHGAITIAAAKVAPLELDLVRARLMAAGVPKGRIRTEATSEGGPGDMTLSYQRFDLIAPPCPGWSVPMDFNPYNLADPGLGCAGIHNIAASAADPADLVNPPPLGAPEGAGVARVGNAYRAGTTTGAAQNSVQATRDQTAAGATAAASH